MTNHLTLADPADRRALFVAYAAAKTRAVELGTTIYDDSIIRAAYEAVRPMLLAEGRQQASADIATFAARAEASAIRYAPESSLAARRQNAAVLGAFERAAAIARDGHNNTHCTNCGDTRGGPFEHETSECTWSRYRISDALDVPRREVDGD